MTKALSPPTSPGPAPPIGPATQFRLTFRPERQTSHAPRMRDSIPPASKPAPLPSRRRQTPTLRPLPVAERRSALIFCELHKNLESRVFARRSATAFAAEVAGPPSVQDTIVGVGIGAAHRDFKSVGPDGPGAPVLNVYVAQALSMDTVKRTLVDDYGMKDLAPELHAGQRSPHGTDRCSGVYAERAAVAMRDFDWPL